MRVCIVGASGKLDRHAPAGTPVLVTLLGPARLDGWRLRPNLWSATRGCRVVNIVEERGSEVWGALYEVSLDLVTRRDGKRSVVDRLERHRTTIHPENYTKVCVTLDLDGEPMAAWTYIGLREAIDRCEHEHPETVCDADYVGTVIAGAESVGLPVAYRAALRSVGHRLGGPLGIANCAQQWRQWDSDSGLSAGHRRALVKRRKLRVEQALDRFLFHFRGSGGDRGPFGSSAAASPS